MKSQLTSESQPVVRALGGGGSLFQARQFRAAAFKYVDVPQCTSTQTRSFEQFEKNVFDTAQQYDKKFPLTVCVWFVLVEIPKICKFICMLC